SAPLRPRQDGRQGDVMRQRERQYRLLIYSHDSFGLGHLRRCRTIAHALVGHRADISVLILSGSPIIGSFSFRNRVDFVRIPGVIKLRRGDYTPLNLEIGIDEILALRASIIRHTAEAFEPDIFLVDKEPWGLRGEVRETLVALKARGTTLVLGLRDVMDEPRRLAIEWQRKRALPALNDLYDEIWIYGLPEVCNPLSAIDLPAATAAKVHYTGYLRRTPSPAEHPHSVPAGLAGNPYLLVTTGGGGDGAQLVDWVLRAYEHAPDLPFPALLVLGPFMRSAMQADFIARVEHLNKVFAITFDAAIENLMVNAAGIVAMGGYNTFCEILSFDKPALIVPRTTPRMEQLLRASRAEALGLASMLVAGANRSAETMAARLRDLPAQPRPSAVHLPALLGGLPVITEMVDGMLQEAPRARARLAVVGRSG
ncbi:MAG: glycosyltransferase family protein, partial [Rhodospirillales bacterium]